MAGARLSLLFPGSILTGRLGEQTSFEMHTKLAQELDVQSFRMIQALSTAGGQRQDADVNMLNKFSWLDRNVGKISVLDPETAQV